MKEKIIFLADDDQDDSEMFSEALSLIDDSITFLSAPNGRELLTTLEESAHLPDLIFLDLNMPVMNGWECLKHLKADDRYKQIPVTIISTASHEKEIKTALELGALCYFVKPSNFKQLIELIRTVVLNPDKRLSDAQMQLPSDFSGKIYT